MGGKIEVRAFSSLRDLFTLRGEGGKYLVSVNLEGEITAAELAEQLNIPRDKIEVVFLNGLA